MVIWVSEGAIVFAGTRAQPAWHLGEKEEFEREFRVRLIAAGDLHVVDTPGPRGIGAGLWLGEGEGLRLVLRIRRSSWLPPRL
jgi:hypothetical protein